MKKPSEIKPVKLNTGVALQYIEQGNSDGTPVILLHGLGDSLRSFDLVLPHLPDTLHTFVLSQRGHGDSDRPDKNYRIHDYAEDVRAFLDALKIEKAVIVGHSLGSAVAQRFAIYFPERCMGLVLISSFYSLAKNKASQDLWEIVSSWEDPVDQESVREFQESTLENSVPDDFFKKIILKESSKVPAQVWKETVNSANNDDFSDNLYRIKAPTLLIWGDKDSQVSREEQEAQTAAIKESRLLVYEDHGHAIPWEAPVGLAADLIIFIETRIERE